MVNEKTSWNKGKKMSDTHRQNISDSRKGKPAWNKGIKGTGGNNKTSFKKGQTPWNKGKTYKGWKWKNGIRKTPISQAIRISTEYIFWRKSIFQRDNYTCQKTGVSGGELVAHHINNFSDHPELRFDIENGITLSKESHQEFHRIYGVKNNTKEQIQNYLSSNL